MKRNEKNKAQKKTFEYNIISMTIVWTNIKRDKNEISVIYIFFAVSLNYASLASNLIRIINITSC